jgi:signal transduction histidine kinase
MHDPEAESATPAARDFRLRPWLILPLGLGVGLLSGTYSYLLQRWMTNGVVHVPIGEYGWVVSFNLIVWTWWFALITGALWVVRHLRITRANAWRSVPAHVLLALTFGALNGLVVGGVRHWVFWLAGFLDMAEGSRMTLLGSIQRELLNTFESQVLIYGGVVAMSHVIQFNRALQDRELQHSRLQARLVEAQLAALQRQLQPHFLFNTLHAIASLVHRDPDVAEAMIVRLGDLLRAVFRSDVRQEVALAQELRLVEQYLDIQRMRFGGGLHTTIDVAADVADVPVPVLLLQPLVENAIKHGFPGPSREGEIRVSAARIDGRVQITVSDNGQGLSGRSLRDVTEGVGLRNTRARLEHLYPGTHTVSVEAPAAGGFAVTITLPAQESAASSSTSPSMRASA